MTEPSEPKSGLDLALDLFVFAPIGLVLETPKLLPKLVARGRSQVGFAGFIGKHAVNKGKSFVAEQNSGAKAGAQADKPETSGSPEEPEVEAEAAPSVDPVDPADLAIDDYRSLSASQVVPLLDGLNGVELDLIERFEHDYRGRKTILGKIATVRDRA